MKHPHRNGKAKQRRENALMRLTERGFRTNHEQLMLCDERRGNSTKERTRLGG